MSLPRIAIVVDHPSRDLPGLVLTAVELCRRGAVCHFVPANLLWREIWALAPDFVLLNYFRRSNESLGQGLVTAGIPFGVLDTEGGVWPEPANYAELLWQDRDLLHRADCVCLWGTRMAEYLQGEGIVTEEQTVVTGCPRFDFYAPAWQTVLVAGGSSQTQRPRVLVNTNFSTRNPRFTTVEKKIETSRRNFGWSDERIFELLRMEEQAIDAIIEMCADLARRFPQLDLVLRPHPFEAADWYARELAVHPNVIIDGEGPVQPAIYQAALVIQRSCTTAIEAGLAGTPTLSPQWVPAPLLMPAAEAVSVACHSRDALAQTVDAILHRRYQPSLEIQAAIDQVTREWFCAADGRAHLRVADAVMRAAAQDRKKDLQVCDRLLYRHDLLGRPLEGIPAAGGRLRQTLGLPPEWSFKARQAVPPVEWTHTSKCFGAGEVQALADRIVAAMGKPAGGVSPIRAQQAAARGEFRHGFAGYSVTLWSDGDHR